MNENDNMDEELKDSPLLQSLNRENPFKVPEGYFESFPSLVSERIASENSKPGWVILLKNVFQPKFMIAACVFVLVLFSGILYFDRTSSVKDKEILLSYDDLNNFNYVEQLDEGDLIDAYSSFTDSETDRSNSDIENYLIDNHTDISLIENEL